MPAHTPQDPFAELDSDPHARGIAYDLNLREAVIEDLIRARKAGRLNQTVVAKRMGVGQPTVSEFENEATDPRLSTLQRYARAVGATLSVTVRAEDARRDRHRRNQAWRRSARSQLPCPDYVAPAPADVIYVCFDDKAGASPIDRSGVAVANA